MSSFYNIAELLTQMAREFPDLIAIAEPMFKGKKAKRDANGKREYKTVTFAELDRDSDQIAAGLQKKGVTPQMRLVLMVRQGIDFITLVFALYKLGATLVLIDPGMGVRRMLACLKEANPDGFVGIPEAQYARILYRRWFPNAKYNLIVGKSLFLCGLTLDKLRKGPFIKPEDPKTRLDDPAAIIFTSGSTGVAKGVLYTYRMFKTQVEEITKRLNIKPGAVDLVGFPFFGLFDAGMGMTAVIPDMDTTKPGSVNPELFLEAANDWKITQAFGSPALWNRVARYCLKNNLKIETLKSTAIAGAPVSFELLRNLRKILPDDANIVTPYGATESLPLASIESREVLEETSLATRQGKGVCVGKFFDPPLEHKIIPVTDEPIPRLADVEELPDGQIGELLVSGPQCSPRYVTRVEANALTLIEGENGQIWRRVGDVGYFDDRDRFWFCGRKSHRVETPHGPMFSIPCEAISNESPKVFRSALVGVPLSRDFKEPKDVDKRAQKFRSIWKEPAMVVEPELDAQLKTSDEEEKLKREVLQLLKKSPLTSSIDKVFICKNLPVDVRHNAKINRELLSEWATAKLQGKTIPLANAPIKG
ncbi:MAG: fatty acid CoA ligase family protein [Thermoguttaceae bacterium]|jgi:acyl-CoA synthetase (AMP-forming)/AMP-acid ligase II